MTAKQLRAREEALFRQLEKERAYRGTLYRDGVPTPQVYLRQRVRVVFVFREPNLMGKRTPGDMRDELRDKEFRPKGADGQREERRPSCWWNAKAGLFAHAVAAALDGTPMKAGFRAFSEVMADGGWNHDVVSRFGYLQVKKNGGQPHLVLRGGVGKHSPAQLVASLVLPGGEQRLTHRTRATWWQFTKPQRPRALVQLWHPSNRNVPPRELYSDVWETVREVLRRVDAVA